jgi:hypothetical protein
MDNRNIDVFIISYNRLAYLQSLVLWLEKAGFEKIHIVDNNSTYPPLLEYLKNSKHKVYRMERNYGHLVFWESGKFNAVIDNEYYIVTDCDVLPVDECPIDLANYFYEILEKHPTFTKVGFSLKIDDLPDHNKTKKTIIDWESQFWKNKLEDGLYDSSIDTTFAFYRPGIYPSDKKWWKSIRTDFPYIARHIPWYTDSDNPSEEDEYYQKSLSSKSSFWSITDVSMLKKYNAELLGDLKEVYLSKKWKILYGIYFICSLIASKQKYSAKIKKRERKNIEKIEDYAALQQINKDLVIELGNVQSSAGWRYLEKIENFVKF